MHIPGRLRGALVLALLALAPARAAAQASPYVPLDDPSLPLFEFLVARGVVADPTPQVRPFRQADALRVLAGADSACACAATADGRMIRELIAEWTEPAGDTRWWLAGRAGAQAYTHARREELQPLGEGGANPYVDVTARAVFGPFVAATRPVIEPRLADDPDWPGRRDVKLLSRLAEAYVSAQARFGRLLYGQLDHNWGPVGLPGFPVSDYGYERQGFAWELGTRAVRLGAVAADLHDETDSLGRRVHRYFFAHRLDVRLSPRLQLAAWESSVLGGADRGFETRYRNPLAFSYLSNALGLGDSSNVMLGLDATWRVAGRHTLQAQLALDDFWYQHRDQNRDRWGLTLMATGPVLGRAAYRAYYTQVSALALRTFNRFENFTDAGVGIGRNFTDQDRLSLFVSWPVTPRWLVTPELTLQRQGEGSIDAPYPPAGTPELQGTPALFIGTVERTWRAALGVTGRQGPFALTADAGFHHVVNAGHVLGATDDRIEARLQATLGLGRRGVLRGGD
ncbi:MAG TPA: hypothetical protein VFS40_15895 [Gemmatimonadales bacterium]|nr:hypothetical protein [Gemmatimonadales bacterium]